MHLCCTRKNGNSDITWHLENNNCTKIYPVASSITTTISIWLENIPKSSHMGNSNTITLNPSNYINS